MSEKEKAIELYELCYYKLDSSMPEITKDRFAKTFANAIIDEVRIQSENWGVASVRLYWSKVREALNAISADAIRRWGLRCTTLAYRTKAN